MTRLQWIGLRRVAGLLSGVMAILVFAAPALAVLSPEDTQALAQMALQWATSGGIADFKLTKDPTKVFVADSNLPNKIELKLAERTVIVASLARIQVSADRNGDLLYFRFDRFKGDSQHASVSLALIWAVSASSGEVHLSGGGATLQFERVNNEWRMLPVTERWMS